MHVHTYVGTCRYVHEDYDIIFHARMPEHENSIGISCVSNWHLCLLVMSMFTFGQTSWTPWLIALGMDVSRWVGCLNTHRNTNVRTYICTVCIVFLVQCNVLSEYLVSTHSWLVHAPG